ncbi:hypothetical protein ACQ86K_01125 [Mucilaginibacter sp. P19]|uniref:hypothetical protein n=1 Tax=Mucilaginibacter sp. P19 TaxID=3423947 RepID=UPI003D67C71B
MSRPDRSIPEELHYYDTTDFISFSEDRGRALYWLSQRGKLSLHPTTTNYQETHYLFTLDIDLKTAVDFGDGIYFYSYECNPVLKEPNAPDVMSILEAQLVRSVGCEVCQNGAIKHSLILVNSEQYLTSQNSDQSLDGAIQFARNDKEWLILPADPMSPDFFHARIPRSNIWTVDLFSDGTARDPLHHRSLGQIGDENGNII